MGTVDRAVTRFAVNVGFLFRELPYLERFAAVREAGFEAVESAWPPVAPEAFAHAVRSNALRVVLLNMRAGDLDAGERGFPNDPRRRDEWREALVQALELAQGVGCPTVNVLAGDRLGDLPEVEQWTVLQDSLAWALPRAAVAGVRLVVEVLNPVDTPDYLVTDLGPARRLMDALGPQGLGLQFDTYHVARIAGDVVPVLRGLAPHVGHVQIADVPGRHEPGTGTIDWQAFFRALDEALYEGAIGLEYLPSGDTRSGLRWLPGGERRWSRTAAEGSAPRGQS